MRNYSHLTKHRLEAEHTQILDELRRRYPRRQGSPKYGLLDRGVSPEDFARFLACVRHPKARTIFIVMYGLGLRVSEACSLRSRDVDFLARRVWVRSRKGSHPALLHLHDTVLAALLAHRERYGFGTEYVFPAVKRAQNAHPYLSPHWVRKELRFARKDAGLGFVYDRSSWGNARVRRNLYQFSSHSLRHAFISRVASRTRDYWLTWKASRLVNPRHLARYVHSSQDAVDRAILESFSEEGGEDVRVQVGIRDG